MEVHKLAATGDEHLEIRDKLQGKVMTVQGPVDSDQLGITLPHEHIFLHHTAPDLILSDPGAAIEEVARFGAAGGRTIVEMTSIGLGRNPIGLRRVAEKTGVNIVMGCGYYKAAWHPEDMDGKSEATITDEIVRDIMVGADGTDIRSGIIGELGVSSMTPNEEKALRAGAQAQLRTGAAINLHFDIGAPELLRMRALDIVEREGVDLNRVITSHFRLIPEESDYHGRMADRGTYVEFDLFGQERLQSPTIPEYKRESEVLRCLIGRGHLKRILFSSDICYRQTLVRNGGWGYAHLVKNVVPRLLTHGITEGEIHAIMVENPRSLLPLQFGRTQNLE